MSLSKPSRRTLREEDMESEMILTVIKRIALGVEVLGVAIIALGTVFGAIRGIIDFFNKASGAYQKCKLRIGRALLLGLEFLVAADIITTVLVNSTIREVISLGLLVLVRTVLSWSILLETESRWPWQATAKKEG
jgi:uncharacterized membrane protein